MARSKSNPSDPYAVITARIVHLLEQGTVPWRKPWQSVAPQNLISRHAYRGINPFILSCSGFGSPFWLTFKQAKQLGGHVRIGETASPVVFWKVFPKEVETEDGEKETVNLPVLRRWSVFNVEQCEGIPSERIPDLTPKPFKPVEKAERIVKDMPQAPAIKHGATGAWYEPRADLVRMPDPGHFDPAECYYSTLFHELTHSSGHGSRLSRPTLKQMARFGSPDYSQEELVAEMGAAFLCGESGLEPAVIENQAAYISGWLNRLKGDPRLVVIAAAQAQKSADFILNRQPQQSH
ncbi:MAG TPA: zincin-like metallopeptidase domain-containing protein [Acidobacteriota bacterium]|nr:zincin-like metallopeptidase domain-containing protein [Acidobacteriota bacterium]